MNLCQKLLVPLLTVASVIFFKTRAPVEPVSFVRRICEDAAKHNAPKRTRFCNRLTPMTLMGKATEEGLEKTAKEVLAAQFHTEPRVPTKVSCVATLRNHRITEVSPVCHSPDNSQPYCHEAHGDHTKGCLNCWSRASS